MLALASRSAYGASRCEADFMSLDKQNKIG